MTDKQATIDLLLPGVRSAIGDTGVSGSLSIGDDYDIHRGLWLRLRKDGKDHSIRLASVEELQSGEYKTPFKRRVRRAIEDMLSEP